MCLGGFLPTGLGLIIRDVTVPSIAVASVRAAEAGLSSGVAVPEQMQFGSLGRWLFSAGWGVPIIVSSIMGLLHRPGPRGKTKNNRLVFRALLVVGVAVGVPFAELRPMVHLGIYAAVAVVIALSEFVLIEADRIGMLSGSRIATSTNLSSTIDGDEDHDTDEDGDVSSEMDPRDDKEDMCVPKNTEGGTADEGSREELARLCAIRRQQRHRCKFEAVMVSKRNRRKHCSNANF
jgi:hypothetical protein